MFIQKIILSVLFLFTGLVYSAHVERSGEILEKVSLAPRFAESIIRSTSYVFADMLTSEQLSTLKEKIKKFVASNEGRGNLNLSTIHHAVWQAIDFVGANTSKSDKFIKSNKKKYFDDLYTKFIIEF